jgi:hypothetical protein
MRQQRGGARRTDAATRAHAATRGAFPEAAARALSTMAMKDGDVIAVLRLLHEVCGDNGRAERTGLDQPGVAIVGGQAVQSGIRHAIERLWARARSRARPQGHDSQVHRQRTDRATTQRSTGRALASASWRRARCCCSIVAGCSAICRASSSNRTPHRKSRGTWWTLRSEGWRASHAPDPRALESRSLARPRRWPPCPPGQCPIELRIVTQITTAQAAHQ